MSIQTPPALMLAFWVSLADVASTKLKSEGYEAHASTVGHAAFILWDLWTSEFGESFEFALEKFNAKIHVDDKEEGGMQ